VKMILVLLATATVAPAATGRAAPDAPLRHFYYVNDAAAAQSLDRNRSQIDLLSPVWFSVANGGRLETNLDAHLLEWASTNHLPLMPVLVNQGFDGKIAHALLTSPRGRDDLIISILKIARIHHFYGIELDFENIDPSDREAFSSFAQALGRGLHNLQMKMAISVMSPFGPRQQPDGSWELSPHSAAFDYFQLAAEADLVSLMAYDQHTSPDAPGPIAGVAWVEACVRRLLEFVPSDKLLLGIPLYHRRWEPGGVSEGPFLEAQALATRTHAAIQYDSEQEESMFQVDDPKGNLTVWLYDARALNARLKLAAKYHLRGYSAWRLGQEDPLFWGGQ